jgi:UPF0716 family protein affecting phage T7 exclusion
MPPATAYTRLLWMVPATFALTLGGLEVLGHAVGMHWTVGHALLAACPGSIAVGISGARQIHKRREWEGVPPKLPKFLRI